MCVCVYTYIYVYIHTYYSDTTFLPFRKCLPGIFFRRLPFRLTSSNKRISVSCPWDTQRKQAQTIMIALYWKSHYITYCMMWCDATQHKTTSHYFVLYFGRFVALVCLPEDTRHLEFFDRLWLRLTPRHYLHVDCILVWYFSLVSPRARACSSWQERCVQHSQPHVIHVTGRSVGQ